MMWVARVGLDNKNETEKQTERQDINVINRCLKNKRKKEEHELTQGKPVDKNFIGESS